MDKMREKFVDEIQRLQSARVRSRSAHLKRDYGKAIRRMRKELRDYDRFKNLEVTYDAG